MIYTMHIFLCTLFICICVTQNVPLWMAFIRFERCKRKNNLTDWYKWAISHHHITDVSKTSRRIFQCVCAFTVLCCVCALCASLCGPPHQRSSRWFQTGNTWSRWRQGWHHISSLSPECRHRPRPRLPRRPRRSAPWDLPSWINAGGPTWGCSAACGGGGVTLSPTHPARPAAWRRWAHRHVQFNMRC